MAVAGVVGLAGLVQSSSTPVVATQNPIGAAALQRSNAVLILPAAEMARTPAVQMVQPKYELATAWYKNKSWWKRNAPIVGGAAGGALIGGLAGGGKGVLIGGAAGGGGGYLYKRLKHPKHHH